MAKVRFNFGFKCLIMLLTLFFLQRCNSSSENPLYFSDVIHCDDFKVTLIRNISGSFELTENEAAEIKTKLLKSEVVSDTIPDVGELTLVFQLANGLTYVGRSDPSSSYLEISSEIAAGSSRYGENKAWFILKLDHLNLNNYRP